MIYILVEYEKKVLFIVRVWSFSFERLFPIYRILKKTRYEFDKYLCI